MTKSIIDCPWEIGDKLYVLVNPHGRTTLALDSQVVALDELMGRYSSKIGVCIIAAPLVAVKVVGVRMFDISGDYPIAIRGGITERTYKVVRINKLSDIGKAVLIDKVSGDVSRLEWPDSKPFLEAFNYPVDSKIREVIYVAALNVDGNFKLIEVLDDQNW